MTTAYHAVRARVVAAGDEHYQAQEARFGQLARVLHGAQAPLSVLDYGCGTGDLLRWLRTQGVSCSYTGFDLSDRMVREASTAHSATDCATFTSAEHRLSPADFVFASGIFNLRFGSPDEEWHEYVVRTVDRLRRLSARGFAFNLLSSHSDPERKHPHLHYADPSWWLDHCLHRFSTRSAVLHDYDLWDFTVVVRLDSRAPAPR
jgi:SAM-dependent methyltransferase